MAKKKPSAKKTTKKAAVKKAAAKKKTAKSANKKASRRFGLNPPPTPPSGIDNSTQLILMDTDPFSSSPDTTWTHPLFVSVTLTEDSGNDYNLVIAVWSDYIFDLVNDDFTQGSGTLDYFSVEVDAYSSPGVRNHFTKTYPVKKSSAATKIEFEISDGSSARVARQKHQIAYSTK